ncbi:GTP-binding protein [Blastocystis sp. subtype 4]|uniref:GTP-binding protein n=1 Tax=Blastocystis sp. subtype 4 TaxID=944170 RepID=UPI0007117EA3|nr:GTP-binding protein [Blastocystis sp. subtype 4]KNB42214.1 GTP-binding protein [Blastocystis sp. subtype 4]|eukprot:XP_014525657.1 GTP-binding protein [Blastocystis sp. subtype 4]
MNKIEVKCYINGEPEMGNSSLYISKTESWDQVVYKVSLKVNRPQGSKSVVYNEFGGEITSVAELEDGDKVYFAVDGEPFVPPKIQETVPVVVPKPSSTIAEKPHTEVETTPTVVSTPTVPLSVPEAYVAEETSKTVARPSQVRPADGPAKYVMRFIIVGSMSVGKSCLLLQFTDRKFSASVGPTIGVDFGSSSLNIDGENVKLQIWDTAGQEDFQAITRAYYREAAAAILVYDMTNLQSYEKLQSWLSAVQCNSTNPNIVITLVGNKNDVRNEDKVVSTADGEAFAKENGLLFLETSAKTGYNVDNVFVMTAREIINRIKSGQMQLGEKDGVKVMDAGSERVTSLPMGNNTQGNKKKYCLLGNWCIPELLAAVLD